MPYRRSLITVPAAVALLLLVGSGVLLAGPNRFTRTGGPDGGAVTLLALAPGRLWTATATSGLFTSTDGAATWTAVVGTVDDHAGSGLGADPAWAQGSIGALAADSAHPGTFFAATQDSLFRTADGGASWTPVGLGGTVGFLAVAADGTNVYAAGYVGLWHSTNGGATWRTVRSARPFAFTCLAVDPHRADVLYAGAQERGVLRSLDGGVHWRQLLPQSALGERSATRLAVDPSAPRLYAGTSDGLVFSRDGGTTWIDAGASGPAPGTGQVTALALDPNTPGTVYVATRRDDYSTPTVAALWKSGDAGASWTRLPLGGIVAALGADPTAAGHLYAGTVDDGIQESRDGGATWAPANRGLAATAISWLVADPFAADTLYAAAQGGSRGVGVFKSGDRGATWQAASAGLGTPPASVSRIVADPKTAGTLYAASFGQGLFKTTDGAATWQAIDNGLPMDVVRDVAIDPREPRNLYAVGFQSLPSPQILANAAAKSTDGGATWTAIGDLADRDFLAAVAVDPRDPATIYAGELYLFRSRDHGVTWRQLDGPNNNNLAQLIPDPKTGALYALTQNNGVFESRDHGTTWKILDGLFNFLQAGSFGVALAPGEPGTLYSAGYNGVVVTTDDGDGFVRLDPTFTNLMGTIAIEPHPLGTIYTSSFGGGSVFSYTPGPSTCTPSATAACLAGGRFRVEATADDYQAGSTPSAARPLSDLAAGFRLRGPSDDELVAKVLDARAIGLDYLVMFNSLTSSYSLRLTDTATGRLRAYVRPDGVGRIDVFPAHGPEAGAAALARQRAAAATAGAASGARSVAPHPCVADDTTLCLFDGRFEARVIWKTGDGGHGNGHPFPFHLVNGGGFWFFSPDNPELMLQLFDVRQDTGHFWLYRGGLSSVDYTLQVTDTTTGVQKLFLHPPGNLELAVDTDSF